MTDSIVRVYENLRTLSYAPFYLAAEHELFSRHGVNVDIQTSASTTETAAGLLAGRVDVSWGGPMRVMKHHDEDPHCPLVCFCKVVGPEPFSLVGRYRNNAFKFSQLQGLRVGAVTDVPTPWLLLQEDLRREGIDPQNIDRGASGLMNENVRALADSQLDVIQVMEPFTGAALAAGGYLWHRFSARGDVAFTSFYTTREFIQTRPEACRAMSAALQQALELVQAAPIEDLTGTLISYFPDYAPRAIAAGIARYRIAGIWQHGTSLLPAEFVRLKLALLSGGFIARDVPYHDAVATLE